ncbi:MAG TPA: sigma-54 dependent transcriptional regulator [Ignavibacteria bacterium]|nr:sigma-54 dependent transcriptional regulator [Ignavibacteria bacterium]HMQ99915.1 sigma-54 dependent transcriptional regulator [Ignavibacteria bacterium]
MNSKVLIIDDEPAIRSLLERILTLDGFAVITAPDFASGIAQAEKENIAVIVTDVKLPDGSGIDLTRKIKSAYPDIEIIVITAFGQIKDGVEAMKNGAFDYLVKGDDDDKLPLTVKRAYEKAMMHREVKELRSRIDSKFAFSKIIGKSKKISEAIEFAKKAAPTDTTVLLLGETGTGKELFAQAIHNSSKRAAKKFIAVNCSAIPKDLQESEFFGHKKGAFTGAVNDKKGYFEEANGGTIFLDEIGEMSMQTQAKLLRTIEEKTYLRVGDPKEHTLDIRIIAATNRDLKAAIAEGTFREDLYYRLNTFTIHLPSLAERPDDLDILISYFVDYYSEKLNKKIGTVRSDFADTLKSYRFKGNIRELKNIIERAVILAGDNQLTKELLPEEYSDSKPGSTEHSLESVEKAHIIKTLKDFHGNKTQTAKALGIGTVTLYRKLKEYGIE